ncbi:MAG: flavodoxin [Bacteroidales bacterium]|jgi:flavodoxin I|nr:flavodoxin [Bacteroidales bacterium]
MNTIGIFYGSTNGNTQDIAKKIANKLGVNGNDVHDVVSAKADDLKPYDVLLFGSSTWGVGDLQDDWESFIRVVGTADLSGKKVALFGCGDSSSYSDSFCSALGKIYHTISDKTTVIGFTGTGGYSFDASEAVIGNQFVGLALDDENESALSEQRIDQWVATLKMEI